MDTKNGIKERVALFLKEKNMLPSHFERVTGLGNGWCGRPNNIPSRATLSKISRAFPNLSMEWLLNGEGEMEIESTKNVTYTDNSSHNRYDNSAVGNGNSVMPVALEAAEWRKAILEIVSKHQENVKEIIDSQMKQNKEFLDTIKILAQK